MKNSLTGSCLEFTLCSHEEEAIFQVQDAGIGIFLENQVYQFGVAILKRCVEVDEGEIAVESKFRVGTAVEIQADKSSSNFQQRKPMRKILVIEDEETVRENILELLDAEGFETITAENGRIGLALAQQELPDLILCDIRMPELDGYGVLQGLRAAPETATIPVMFLTAKAAKTDLSLGLELGANDYITKPFTLSQLLEAIASHLDNT